MKVTLSAQEASKNIEKELDEVEGAIGMFKSKKQVYLSSDNSF